MNPIALLPKTLNDASDRLRTIDRTSVALGAFQVQ